MKLKRTEFDILTFLESKKDGTFTQRELAKAANMSLGTINKVLVTLREQKLIEENSLTTKGLEALEPYRVKRAVFIAAGFGSRLVPITLNTPKPLVRVKGVRIIDTLLDAVVAAGIEEIIIVRGYLGEQFDQLLYKYPSIKFVENPAYNEANNISSALCVRYQLKNAYVFEADLFLYNPALITKYQYASNYLGAYTDITDDWCFENKNGFISKVKVGGKNCHQMVGISYWNEEDGTRLSESIKQVYEMPGGKERYWDQVPLEFFIKQYLIEVRECSFDDIIEIDTFSELKKLDETYRT
jgi:CTP:phosphocholine cytidylyltransferase-like protein/predicted transcriptional regulator